MKTVLFLEQQSWRGGAQRVLDAVLGSLSPAEFHPIVSFPGAGNFRSSLEQRGTSTVSLRIGEYGPGKKSLLDAAEFGLRTILCSLKLALLIRRKGVSLIYINGPRCLPAGVLGARLAGIPAVFHLHLVLTRSFELRLVTCLCGYVSKILTCSLAVAQPLLKANPALAGKIEVVYNPATEMNDSESRLPETAAANRVPGVITIGTVGRITPGKGQHVLLHAVAGLPDSLQAALRIVVVGSPARDSEEDVRYEHELRRFASCRGLGSRIVWAGYQEDIARWYRAMDVLVHCPAMEGLGLVLVEALQCGVPVIASRVGGIGEVLEDGVNGLLIEPGNEEALRGAITRFVQDCTLRRQIERGARHPLPDRFSAQRFGARVQAVLQELSAAPAEAEPSTGNLTPWN